MSGNSDIAVPGMRGRPERPIDPEAPFADFASRLRAARRRSGLTYQQMAKEACYSATALARAADGNNFPSWPLTRAYILACGADQLTWRERWRRADPNQSHRESQALDTVAVTETQSRPLLDDTWHEMLTDLGRDSFDPLERFANYLRTAYLESRELVRPTHDTLAGPVPKRLPLRRVADASKVSASEIIAWLNAEHPPESFNDFLVVAKAMGLSHEQIRVLHALYESIPPPLQPEDSLPTSDPGPLEPVSTGEQPRPRTPAHWVRPSGPLPVAVLLVLLIAVYLAGRYT